NAAPGDSIAVSYGSGSYSEQPLIINKPLTIIGEIYNNQIPTISAQNSDEHVISITGSTTRPVHIENFEISGATGDSKAGIHSSAVGSSTNGISFQNLRVTGNFFGIVMTSTSMYHFIDDCYIYTNSDDGIVFNGLYHEINDCGALYQANTGIYDNGRNGISSSSLSFSTIEDTNIYDNGEKGIYFKDTDQNSILNTEIWNNDMEGVFLEGTGNTLDGSDRNIKNNHYGSTTDGLDDVYIYGTSNTIQNYNVFQTSEVLDSRTGIYMTSNSENNPNDIKECNVYGYDCDDGDSLGIEAYNTDITGSTMRVHDCDYGIKMDDNCELDCDNTAFSYENIYDNYIGVEVVGSSCAIKETYFTADGSGEIGIYIYNEFEDREADIDNCEFYLLGDKGIYIIDSDMNHYSTIDYCTFDTCLYGIYIYSGEYEDINYCTFSNGDVGVYLSSSSNIDIKNSDFSDMGVVSGSIDTGIYGNNADDLTVESCTFDDNEKGIWLDSGSVSSDISGCDFKDNAPLFSGGSWGTNSCEIGIYLCLYSDYATIENCDFDGISYAIGLKGARYIDINGDSTGTPAYSTISNANHALYATYSGTVQSSGDICYYGSSNTVCLIGVPDGSSTDFTYSSLSGTWTVSGSSSNYNWS
ncbi:MAG: right-handed parallel beta-helix repeat-containing protein, partial [Thermodesulfobacteriota bacterium]|nr:right-handed parallel beta-helix repeat-containing protein [Thermodesulfobacteriota bacterium]